MAMSMQQVYALQGLGNLGQAAGVVTGIVAPLAQAGADIFRTHADSKLSRKELKQREREFQRLIPIYQEQMKLSKLGEVAAVRRAQIAQRSQRAFAPYLLGAVAIGGLALVAIGVSRGG